jgi:hypothetical protein
MTFEEGINRREFIKSAVAIISLAFMGRFVNDNNKMKWSMINKQGDSIEVKHVYCGKGRVETVVSNKTRSMLHFNESHHSHWQETLETLNKRYRSVYYNDQWTKKDRVARYATT